MAENGSSATIENDTDKNTQEDPRYIEGAPECKLCRHCTASFEVLGTLDTRNARAVPYLQRSEGRDCNAEKAGTAQ